MVNKSAIDWGRAQTWNVSSEREGNINPEVTADAKSSSDS